MTGKAVVTRSKVTGDKQISQKSIVIPDPDDISGLLGVIEKGKTLREPRWIWSVNLKSVALLQW
jgi:hypothetical protein